MLHPPMIRPLKLHRPLPDRLWLDALDTLKALGRRFVAALRERRRRRLEREAWSAAMELDARVLRDIGAPDWLQSQAESMREHRRLERSLADRGLRRELRHFR